MICAIASNDCSNELPNSAGKEKRENWKIFSLSEKDSKHMVLMLYSTIQYICIHVSIAPPTGRRYTTPIPIERLKFRIGHR